MIGRLRCFLRGQHLPARQVLGGFRCRLCGVSGRDLAQMGFADDAYVRTDRRLFSRDRERRPAPAPAWNGWGW